MKAVRVEEFGSISLKEIDIPTPKSNEVLVKIQSSSINPVDHKIGNGMLGFLAKQPFPLTLGWDMAGDIVEVGSNVTDLKAGDRVFAMSEIGFDGTLAEYCIVKPNEVAIIPEGISYEQAGTLPMTFLTAWQALVEAGKLKKGQRLLIQQAAGGVGHIAIQIAKNIGAYVIVMTSQRNHDFVKSLGADEVIDYENQDFVQYLAEQPVDIVLESLYAESQTAAVEIVKRGGKLVSISGLLPETEEAAQRAGVEVTFVFVEGNGQHLDIAAELMLAGKLESHISSTITLNEFALGFEKSQTGKTRGKIAVLVDWW